MSTEPNTDTNSTKEDTPAKISLEDPSLFLNRELSWIRFNTRVLEEAQDPWHPLLERIKFLAICGSNLDEFFMTRVPRLLKKVTKGSLEKSPDGMTAYEQIEATRKEIIPLLEKHSNCWKELLPFLAAEEINIKKVSDLNADQRTKLREHFKKAMLPTFKDLKLDLSHTFVDNLHVNLLIVARDETSQDAYHIVDVPTEQFGRLIKIPKNGYDAESSVQTPTFEVNMVFLEDVIANNLDLLYPSEQIMTSYPFRLTRNGEIDILMDESSDFLLTVKKSLQNRKGGFASRLEFDRKMPENLIEVLANLSGLPSYLLYDFDGPLGLVDLWQLLKLDRPELKDKTFLPDISPLLTTEKNLFATIAKRDFVLYHPYDGFEIIIELLREAARDRDVTEICLTLYRMDNKSPVIDALIEAAKNGKKVTSHN